MNKLMTTYKLFVTITLLLFSVLGLGQNQRPVQLSSSIFSFDTVSNISIQTALNVFENSERSVITESTTYGFTTKYHWLKLTLINNSPTSESIFVEIKNPHIDLLKAWELDSKNTINRLYTGGDALPFYERTVISRNLDIPVSLLPNSQKSIYIMADKRNASLSIPITILSAGNYKNQMKKSYFLYGVYFGIMLLIILFAFFIFTILNQKIFFWYAFYISFLALYLMAHVGFLFQLVHPNFNTFNDYSRPIFISISSAALIHFIRLLLNIKTLLPKFNKWYNTLIITLITTTFWWSATPWWHDQQTIIFLNIQNSTLLCSLILVLLSSILTYKEQRVVVQFFWVAFLAVLLSGIFIIMIESGVINESNLDINPLFIGSLIEVLVFAMGLSHWSKVNERERLRLAQIVHNNKLKMMDSYLNGIESEKQKISSDLHDDIGSSLSHLKRKIEMGTTPNPLVLPVFDKILKKVRSLSHDLAPPVFKTNEFLNSIHHLVQAHESETTSINLQVFNTPFQLCNQTKKQLYRIIQNGLVHIEKNANASAVDVQLFYHKNELALAIEDNGFSFQFDKNKPSMEIKEMETRVEILKGIMEISSYSSQGTSIIITLPMLK